MCNIALIAPMRSSPDLSGLLPYIPLGTPPWMGADVVLFTQILIILPVAV